MPKFQVKTYQETVEFLGKLCTVDDDILTEVAVAAFIYNQDLRKVGQDVAKFAIKWQKLIDKDERNSNVY